MVISFLFLHENIYCGYSLEAPHRGEIRKILCGYPLLTVAMSDSSFKKSSCQLLAKPALLAQLDARLTGDQEVVGLTL